MQSISVLQRAQLKHAVQQNSTVLQRAQLKHAVEQNSTVLYSHLQCQEQLQMALAVVFQNPEILQMTILTLVCL